MVKMDELPFLPCLIYKYLLESCAVNDVAMRIVFLKWNPYLCFNWNLNIRLICKVLNNNLLCMK